MQSQAFMKQLRSWNFPRTRLCCLLFFFLFMVIVCFSVTLPSQSSYSFSLRHFAKTSVTCLHLSHTSQPPRWWHTTTSPGPLARRCTLRICSSQIAGADFHTSGFHSCRNFYIYIFVLVLRLSTWDILANTKIQRRWMEIHLWHLTTFKKKWRKAITHREDTMLHTRKCELQTTITCHECNSCWWKGSSELVWPLPQKKRVTRENRGEE